MCKTLNIHIHKLCHKISSKDSFSVEEACEQSSNEWVLPPVLRHYHACACAKEQIIISAFTSMTKFSNHGQEALKLNYSVKQSFDKQLSALTPTSVHARQRNFELEFAHPVIRNLKLEKVQSSLPSHKLVLVSALHSCQQSSPSSMLPSALVHYQYSVCVKQQHLFTHETVRKLDPSHEQCGGKLIYRIRKSFNKQPSPLPHKQGLISALVLLSSQTELFTTFRKAALKYRQGQKELMCSVESPLYLSLIHI